MMSGGVASPASYPHPMKKQRGGITPESEKGRGGLSQETDEAISARRQELARLQTSFQKRPNFAPSGSREAPPIGYGPPMRSAPPLVSATRGVTRAPPGQQRFAQIQVRKSDLFPTVPKSETSAAEGELAVMAMAATAAAEAQSSSATVARRLDENFEDSSKSGGHAAKEAAPIRSASAPPSRPPPPLPPPSSAVVEPQPGSQVAAPVPPQVSSRNYVGRPKPDKPHFQAKEKAGGKPPQAPPTMEPPATAPSSHTDTAPPPRPTDRVPPNANKSAAAVHPPQKVSFFQPPKAAAPEPSEKKTTFSVAPATPPSTMNTTSPIEQEDGALSTESQPTKAFAGATPFPASGKVTAGHTPFIKGSDISSDNESMPSARKDMLMGMRAVADTPSKTGPPNSNPNEHEEQQQESSAELRVQLLLVQEQREKTSALRRVAELEQQLEKVKRESATKTNQQPASLPNAGFLSPLAPSSLPMSPPGTILSPLTPAPRRRRVPTPHPKKVPFVAEELDDDEEDEDLLPFLSEAATLVPHEYESDTASFVVRRPYGIESNQELWFENGQVGAKVYQQNASARQMESLEIVSVIAADGSKLVVYGLDSVRHGSREGLWQEFPSSNPDIGEDEKPLGNVTYIDAEANECMYSLDTLYQSAVSVRELYCSSILSTAIALRQKKKVEGTAVEQQPEHEVPMMQAQEQQPPPPLVPEQPRLAAPPPMLVETSDACVDTGDLPQPQVPPQHEQAQAPPEPHQPKEPPEESGSPPVVPIPEPSGAQVQKSAPLPEEGDSNILGAFVGMLLSLFWTLFVELPWRILSTILTLVVAIGVVAFVWLYLAESNVFVLRGTSARRALIQSCRNCLGQSLMGSTMVTERS